MFLTPIDYNKQIENKIASRISEWIYDNIFAGIFDILKISNRVYNANTDIVQNAIIQGKIYYQNGAFYSYTKRFNNEIARELENIGAKYSKYRKAYVISENKLPTNILWAIETEKTRTATTVRAIVEFLTMRLGAINTDSLIIDEFVNQLMLNLQEQVYKNAQAKKIELISPKLDDFTKNEITQNYINNLDFWIKNFTETEISKMRKDLSTMILDGKSTKFVSEYIQKRYDISKRKALFLARTESAIATTSYLIAKYQAEGINSYKWSTSHDERVRELHRELDGQIFTFDNPPIIDKRTQQRGNPGETFNCRCIMIPQIDKDFLQRRRELYEKNHRLVKL